MSPEALAALYRAASEPIRVRILAVLAHGELCVCHLHAVLGAPQPTVSRHLAILRQARLVQTRRAGSWVHYALSEDAERWLSPAIVTWRSSPDPAAAVRHRPGCEP